jgi:uncharacterized protein
MADHEKLVFMVTHGPDHPEHCTIPFVMAAAALASDVEVVLGFQADGVCIARKGEAEHVEARAFPPLTKLINDFRELGGRMLVCGPCLKGREIDESELIDGAEVVAAGRFIAEITSATNALVY